MRLTYRSAVPYLGDDVQSSLPFCWLAEDGLDARSGQTGTFVRGSVGASRIDSVGNVWGSAHTQPRYEAVLDAVTGFSRRGLLLDPPLTNLILYSDDLSNWTANGSPPTATIWRDFGIMSMWSLQDNASGTLQSWSRSVTLTGDGVKDGVLHVAQDTSVSSVLRLRDTTASADRLVLQVEWSGGIPVVTAHTGTFVGQRLLTNGAWEIRFLTTAATAANAHTVFIYPATDETFTATPTGKVYFGGAALYNLTRVASYSESGAAADSVVNEYMNWTLTLPKRRVWMYLAYTNLGGLAVTGSGSGFCVFGDIASCGVGLYNTGPGQLGGFHYTTGTGGGPSPTVAALAVPFGSFVEQLVTMDQYGKLSVENAYDLGTSVTATSGSNAVNMTTAYASGLVRLGSFGASFNSHGGVAYHALKIGEYGAGTPTLAKARGYW